MSSNIIASGNLHRPVELGICIFFIIAFIALLLRRGLGEYVNGVYEIDYRKLVINFN